MEILLPSTVVDMSTDANFTPLVGFNSTSVKAFRLLLRDISSPEPLRKYLRYYLWNAFNAETAQIIDGRSLLGLSPPSCCRFNVTCEQPPLKSNLSGRESHVCKESRSAI